MGWYCWPAGLDDREPLDDELDTDVCPIGILSAALTLGCEMTIGYNRISEATMPPRAWQSIRRY